MNKLSTDDFRRGILVENGVINHSGILVENGVIDLRWPQ